MIKMRSRVTIALSPLAGLGVSVATTDTQDPELVVTFG